MTALIPHVIPDWERPVAADWMSPRERARIERRREVRSVSCPACPARAGDLCYGTRHSRRSNHMERVQAHARRPVS